MNLATQVSIAAIRLAKERRAESARLDETLARILDRLRDEVRLARSRCRWCGNAVGDHTDEAIDEHALFQEDHVRQNS